MKFTDADLAILIIFLLLGASTFIVGMNMMSSGLKKAAGKGVKKFFKKTKDNRIACLGVGIAVTALIQSSAATSVMAVGFINAGVMTIVQGVSVMMGAYIGTTVTGLLAALSSFPISTYLMLFGFVGVILMFFKNEKIHAFGEVFGGLGLLFLGLSIMSAVFKSPSIKDPVTNAFQAVSFPLLLVILGIVFTALVQSSSATSGIVIALASSNAIPFSSALYVILGANIGTFITTLLATIGTNTGAKRAGLTAFFIKIIGGAFGLTVVWILDACGVIANITSGFDGSQASLAAALFNLGFNLISSFVLLPFVGFFANISIKLIKNKEEEKNKKAIKYIDERLLNTPDVALMQVKLEIESMARRSYKNLQLGYTEIVEQTGEHGKEISDREDSIDYMNQVITSFLISLSNKVDMESENIVGSYFHVINDIERIGDHAYNFYEQSLKMKENELMFSDAAKKELLVMYDTVCEMYELAFKIFENGDKQQLSKLHELEDKTDELKRQLSDAHFERVTRNECTIELSPFYSTLISELERIADHLVNIGYSIVNPTGDDEK